MIQFAAKTWKLSIEATIAKLRRVGLLTEVDGQGISKYANQHVRYRKRLLELWDNATTGMERPSTEQGRLIYRYNLRSAVPSERWMDGPGVLLGGIETESVERAFAPGAMDHADEKGQRANPSAHAIFRGTGWRDVLVIPFFDLPGRICSFLFIGRDGSYPNDFVFRRANYGPRGNQHQCGPYEAGLAMHPDVLESADDWDRTVVAVSDPIVALQLQMRHFEQSQRSLPMVMWYDSMLRLKQHRDQARIRTINAWQMLGNRQIVLWMPQFSTSAIHQAIERNALVSTVGPRQKGTQALKEFVAKFTPRDLTRHIIQSARPWPTVLSNAVERMTDSAVERIFQRLQHDGVNVELELESCSTDARQRVRAVLAETGERSGRIGSRMYVERHGKWYLRRKGSRLDELIADAVLRIDYVINHRKQGRIYLKGRILYEGKSVSLCDSMDLIEADTFAWMRNLLMEKGVGFLVGNPGHSKHLVQIARLFSEPKITSADDRIGWDDKKQRFVFPKFAITRGGETKSVNAGIFAAHTPARRIQEPTVLSPEEVERGDPAYWAAMAAIVGNIIAPACGEPTCGIGVDGNQARDLVEEIAQALDCREHAIGNIREVRQVINEEHDHGWPVHVRRVEGLQRRAWKELLREPSDRNIVTALNWHEGRIMALHGTWHILHADLLDNRVRDREALSRLFVPAYLRHFSKGGLLRDRWNRPMDNFIQELLRDLVDFVETCGGDSDAVRAATEYIWPASESGNGQALAELIVRLLVDDELKIVPDPSSSARIAVLRELNDGDTYLLSRDALAKVLSRHAAPPLPTYRITAAVRSASALVREEERGWTLSKEWLRKHQRLAAATESGLLKVVG
jgi:hypothetical protein